jgi:hypothetical protein
VRAHVDVSIAVLPTQMAGVKDLIVNPPLASLKKYEACALPRGEQPCVCFHLLDVPGLCFEADSDVGERPHTSCDSL